MIKNLMDEHYRNKLRYFCYKHEQEIDYFCLLDQHFICQLCARDKHQDEIRNLQKIQSVNISQELDRLIKHLKKRIHQKQDELDNIYKQYIEQINTLFTYIDSVKHFKSKNIVYNYEIENLRAQTEFDFFNQKFKDLHLDQTKKPIHIDLKQDTIMKSQTLNANYFDQLQIWLDKPKLDMDMIYQATRDGWETTQFHNMCGNKTNLLLIFKTRDNHIFGAFTNLAFSKFGKRQQGDGGSFLFTLTRGTKHICIDHNFEISGHYNYFTFGYDLQIHNLPNEQLNKANLGNTYQLPIYVVKDSERAKQYLTGKQQFFLDQFEAFIVNN